MARRLIVSIVFLLIISIVSMGLGCAAPATPTPTSEVTPKVTPGVTPAQVAPAVQTVKIKISSGYGMADPSTNYMLKFKELIEERSGGKIKVDFYPLAQLMPQQDEYPALGTGAIQMFSTSATVLASFGNPAWMISDVGTIYLKDEKAWLDFWAEPAGGGYFKSFTEKDGIKIFDYWVYSSKFPMMLSNNKRPVKKLEDWKGLKLVVTPGKEWQHTIFGAVALGVPVAERPIAIQTRMVDGTTATIKGTHTSRFWEVCKYGTSYLNTYGDAPNGRPVMANLAWWKGLNEPTRTMVEKAVADAARWINEVWTVEIEKPAREGVEKGFGDGFYDLIKQDPAEAKRHRVLFAEALSKELGKSLPPEMLNLLETKYRY